MTVLTRLPGAGAAHPGRTTLRAIATALVASLPVQPVAGESPCAFDRALQADQYTARVTTEPVDGACSLVTLRVGLTPPGAREARWLKVPEADPAVGAWLDDLDGDGRPEVVVHTRAAGSGSYGGLVVLGWADGRFVRYRLPPLPGPLAAGYGGRDRFHVEGGRVLRSFPVYRPGDPNCCPGGERRRLSYRLGPEGLLIDEANAP